MPEPLSAKGGLTRTASLGRRPSSAAIASARSASPSLSRLIVTPGANRRFELASRLAGPGEADRQARVARPRAAQLAGRGDVEAVDMLSQSMSAMARMDLL